MTTAAPCPTPGGRAGRAGTWARKERGRTEDGMAMEGRLFGRDGIGMDTFGREGGRCADRMTDSERQRLRRLGEANGGERFSRWGEGGQRGGGAPSARRRGRLRRRGVRRRRSPEGRAPVPERLGEAGGRSRREQCRLY